MAIKLATYKVKLELLEDMLGTVPKDKKVYETYIASKAAEHTGKKGNPPFADGTEATLEAATAIMAEEVDTVQQMEDRGWTGYHQDEEGPFLYDYAMKGFLCEAARTLQNQQPTSKKGDSTEGIKQMQDKFKRFVFVRPRRIRLVPVSGVLERPLRAITAQGPRVTLVRSDVISAGSTIEFTLQVLAGSQISKGLLRDVLDYGQFIGLGQWRSGGFGRCAVVDFNEID